MNRHGSRRHTPSSIERKASPDLLRSIRPQRSRRRTFRRLARRLSSPLALVLVVGLMAGGGRYISTLLQAQRLEQRLMTPKTWPATTLALRVPVTAELTTSLRGAFLHYRLAVNAGSADSGELETTFNLITLTIRLLDKDGFTILVIRPADNLTRDASGGSSAFRVEDVVGCSPQVYASATSWSVEWEGK